MSAFRLFAMGLAGITGIAVLQLPAQAGNNDRPLSDQAMQKYQKKFNYSPRQSFFPQRFDLFNNRGFFSLFNGGDPQGGFDPTPETPPDPDRNLGPYTPAKLVVLSDPTLQASQPQQALASTILFDLRNAQSSIRVTAGQRDAIISFYAQRGFLPVWVTSEGLSDKAKEVLALLAHADAEGLNANDYLPPVLGAFTDDMANFRGDVVRLSNLDIGLTAMAVRYAEHAYSGRIIPDKLSNYYDVNPPVLGLPATLAELDSSTDAAAYLSALHPSSPSYRAMKRALGELHAKSSEGGEEPIPAGLRVKVGERDARVPMIRARLIKFGYLPQNVEGAWRSRIDTDAYTSASFEPSRVKPAARDENVLDKELSKSLKAFQTVQKIKPTGRIDAATIDAFNARTDSRNIQKLVMNMERIRWLPRDLGVRHIMVNQAAFELRLMEHDKISWMTRVIVGKPQTQTAVFSDEMEMVVINPYWGVPGSIIKHEMLPMLARDPYYLDRKGFEVVAPGGVVVSSGSVDWWSYGDRIPFDVRQPPGPENALGNIKFLFPNSHDIYMHDTPMKNLFAEQVRAFSHGCVRVQNPRELAVRVLGWDRMQLDNMIDSGINQTVNLPVKIPVHLTYFTAWPDASGKIVYYPDIYGRDARLETALGAIAIAAN